MTIPVSITVSHSRDALQSKLDTLYNSGGYSTRVSLDENSGRYTISNLRMLTKYSEDNNKSIGLLKGSPYNEKGGLTGFFAAVYPELEILQHGTNKSLTESPWLKLTQEQKELLHSIKPVFKTDSEGKPTSEPDYNHVYGNCATGVCP